MNRYEHEEHILVCLSSAPSNAKIIHTAARMAEAFHGSLTALYVQTPDFSAMEEENRRRLDANTRFAKNWARPSKRCRGTTCPIRSRNSPGFPA